LGLGVEAAVRIFGSSGQFDVETHRLAAGTGFRELWVLENLEAPALVLGQVPHQHVELVERHPVDQFLNIGDALKMPSGIEEQRAPCETRVIIDDALGYLSRGATDPAGRRKQLPQGDSPIEGAGRRARNYPDSF